MIDYTTKSAPSSEIAPEGDHNAMITKVDIYNSPNGTDKLMVKFTFENEDSHTEFIIPAIMEGEEFRCFADLMTLISGGAKLEDSGSFDEQDLIGLECVITIKHTQGKGKYKGRTFANVLKIEAPKKKA